ncbi:MAG: low molecular weight phosphotyrosine protein phosphatase [Selenomonadaceae bacterium]|nr:low molecular weight phosphotyrosine protein phosphatase [Selenomonadaceae bacterium]
MVMKINFVCLGNICRSPMAEFFMKKIVADAGLTDKISVESSGCHATGYTQISSGTCIELAQNNIPFNPDRISKKFNRADYQNCDYIIAMDKYNFSDLQAMTGGDPDKKFFLMMEFAGEKRDVEDPYITDDYTATYKDISRACTALLKILTATLSKM